jgi:hypothetical protein
LELVKTLKASSFFVAAKICPLILFTIVLDMQSSLFKITIQFNVATTMEAPFHVNPLTWLWWTLEASCILRHFFLEFFKLVEIAIVQMLGLMEDDQTFSTFSFMKSKLRNRFNEHLNIVVGMYFQTFYSLNTFPYDTCFEDWKEKKPRQTLDYILILRFGWGLSF